MLAMVFLFLVCPAISPQAQTEYSPQGPILVVTVEKRGVFEITTDPKSSPKTVAHIVSLAKKGFYDRQRIHRVESWVIQWGAPASRDKPLNSEEVLGGGSGKQLPFEESEVDFTRGVCGIASTGLQVGGDSQIFILKRDWLRLWRSYAVLGKVTRGMEVVDKIRLGDRILRITVRENSKKPASKKP
ncbi:MAG: peptidylprolyl isomerase [Fimbriimonadales bacterium]|nr:peptidylprolyl isomerase [Fimbriimonadales bacterium]